MVIFFYAVQSKLLLLYFIHSRLNVLIPYPYFAPHLVTSSHGNQEKNRCWSKQPEVSSSGVWIYWEIRRREKKKRERKHSKLYHKWACGHWLLHKRMCLLQWAKAGWQVRSVPWEPNEQSNPWRYSISDAEKLFSQNFPAEKFWALKADPKGLSSERFQKLYPLKCLCGGKRDSDMWNTWLQVKIWGFPCSSAGKESTCNAGDPGLIPGWGSSAGEGITYPLRYC